MVTKPSGTEYHDMKMKPIDDFAAPSSTIIALKTLAKNVAAHLGERAFCVIFEDDLERCWPSNKVKRADPEKEIHSFAKSQGWTAVILTTDSGNRAIFRKLGPDSIRTAEGGLVRRVPT